jgi:hypothetical protein
VLLVDKVLQALPESLGRKVQQEQLEQLVVKAAQELQA